MELISTDYVYVLSDASPLYTVVDLLNLSLALFIESKAYNLIPR